MTQQRKTSKKSPSPSLSESDLRLVQLKQSQTEYLEKIMKNEVTFCYGPAGTSKTFTACLAALKLYLNGDIKKIILTKPIQESGEKLGFLPGDVKEKIDPFMESYRSNLVKLLKDAHLVSWLESMGVIEFRPLAYMRGATFDHTLMILDEAQNITVNTFKSIITRIGTNSKYIIMGDTEQIDMKERNKSALVKVMDLFKDSDQVGTVQFTDEDCVRNPIIPYLLDKIKEIE